MQTEMVQPEATAKPVKVVKAPEPAKNLDEKALFKQAKELGKNAGSASMTFANLLKLAASAQREFEVEKFLLAYKSGKFSVDGEDDNAEVSKGDISKIKAAMNLGIQAGDDAERVIDNIIRGRKLAIEQKLVLKTQKDGTNVRLPHHLYESITKALKRTPIPVPGGGTVEVTVDLLTGREQTVVKGKEKVTFNPEGLKKWSVLLALDIAAGGGYEWNEETKVWDLLAEPPKPEAPAKPVQAQPEKDETVSLVDASPAPEPSQDDEGNPVVNESNESQDDTRSNVRPSPVSALRDPEPSVVEARMLLGGIMNRLRVAENLEEAQKLLPELSKIFDMLPAPILP
jgi:hypothetical protein